MASDLVLEEFEDHEAASNAAAALLGKQLENGGAAVLAGGNTPRRAYELLRDKPLAWSRIQLLASDERCLPVGHADRNDRMIGEAFGPLGYTLLDFPAELGAEEAARAMEPRVKELLPFKVALLGLGEDGHTASLFPGQHAVAAAPTLVAPVHDSPKPPPDRVTLTLRALAMAEVIAFLVTGEGKQSALAALLEGGDVPAAMVRGGQVRVLADRAALGR